MSSQDAHSLPGRARFQWDMRSPPWTDGRGNQERYLEAVQLWKETHDALPDSNSNKVPKTLQGIVLKGQLFGRARDLGSKVSDTDLRAPNGAITLAIAIYKIDPLSQVTRMADQFHELLTTKRRQNETLAAFESRFEAQVCRFNEAAGPAILPKALLALLLRSNADIENSQRVALLTSVAPSSTTALSGEALLTAIDYEKVASVLRSSDAPKRAEPSQAMHAMQGQLSDRSSHQKRMDELKKKTRCSVCHQKGHWYNDDVFPKKKKNDNGPSDPPARSRTITFN